ncbi:MAG: PrsW family glutamic-type intramembrane protease, partial [Candidatus Aenigmatarchaeota archaeon]
MFLIIIAIAPTIALFLYFYNKDKYEKEPLELILKAFLVGVVILFPSVIVEQVLLVFVKDFKGTFQIFLQAFLVAGLVEEGFKYMAFKILIYKNKNFNELYDGILYSVMVSLGFATFENLYYVLEYYLWGGFFSGFVVGIVRAILTIPLHCFLGVIMGYFLSLAKFSNDPILET